eukprot:c21962_g2_i2 orf=268-1047(+)
MAMLGKRFQRTISMSQIGPGSNLYAEKGQPHPGEAAQKSAAAAPGARPFVILNDQQQLLHAAANQWEALRASCSVQQDDHHHQQKASANQWEALKVNCSVQQQDYHPQQLQPTAVADQWDILKSAEAMMLMMMAGQSSTNSTDQELASVHELDLQDMATENDPHLQMGLWPHLIINPSAPPTSQYSPTYASSFIPRVDFLDACFFCKRRLRHERDIFIYRGDAAFCTEECRQRQILSDETRSLRTSKEGDATSESEVVT